jgi:hypothetical protein
LWKATGYRMDDGWESTSKAQEGPSRLILGPVLTSKSTANTSRPEDISCSYRRARHPPSRIASAPWARQAAKQIRSPPSSRAGRGPVLIRQWRRHRVYARHPQRPVRPDHEHHRLAVHPLASGEHAVAVTLLHGPSFRAGRLASLLLILRGRKL